MTSNSVALRLVIASAIAFMVRAQPWPPMDPNARLSESTFIFSHNAATGYLVDGGPLVDPLAGYSKNQNGTFTDQLNCGARAFDLEPAEINGVVAFKHGDTEVTEILFEDGVKEILAWSSTDPLGDLILLKLVSCGGTCDASVTAVLDSLNVSIITECSELTTLTVGQTLELGQVVAVAGSCFLENFDESLNCHGFLPDNNPDSVEAVQACVPDLGSIGDNVFDVVSTVFDCLKGTLTPEQVNIYDCRKDEFPFTQLFEHLNQTALAGPPADGRLWQWQALFQTSADAVLLGIFKPFPLPTTLVGLDPSGILRDVEESGVNRRVLEYVTALVQDGVTLNLVEIDNLCDEYGRQLISVVRQQESSPVPTATPITSAAPSANSPTVASEVPTPFPVPTATPLTSAAPSTNSPTVASVAPTPFPVLTSDGYGFSPCIFMSVVALFASSWALLL